MLDSGLGWYSAEGGHEVAVYEMSLGRGEAASISSERRYLTKLWGRTAGRGTAVAAPIVAAGLAEGACCVACAWLATQSSDSVMHTICTYYRMPLPPSAVSYCKSIVRKLCARGGCASCV